MAFAKEVTDKNQYNHSNYKKIMIIVKICLAYIFVFIN